MKNNTNEINQGKKNNLIEIITMTLIMSLLLLSYSVCANNQSVLKNTHKIENKEIPAGLSTTEWQDVRNQIALNKYKAFKQSDGHYMSTNIAQKWNIKYGNNGYTQISPLSDKESYNIGLKLLSIGYDKPNKVDTPQNITFENGKLIYNWSKNVQEIWINSPQSLEQWFEIQQRPEGQQQDTPLEIALLLDSSLSVSQEHDSLNFENKISYNKLKVWDSNNTIMPAKMQLKGKQLSLVVDDSKAVYPLTIDPSFQQQAYSKAYNAGANDWFGSSVAISGNYMVVGATGEASGDGNPFSDNASYAGAVYVFERYDDGQWGLLSIYLKASNIDANDRFGYSVAISGDTIVVGAPGEDSSATGVNNNALQNDNSESNSGAAYVFTRNGNNWIQEAYLKASNTDSTDIFGHSVAISGNRIIIGAPNEDSNATTIDGNDSDNSSNASGAAYMFVKTGNTWSQEHYLKADNTGVFDAFGIAVAISGSIIVVGASGENSNSTGVDGDGANNSALNSGAAYVFSNINTLGGVWHQTAYLKASNTGISDGFGGSVAVSGNLIAVGATGENSSSTGVNGDQADNSEASSGAVYVFRAYTFLGGGFQTAYIKSSNTQANDNFGESVAISGNLLVIGADAEDSIATGIDGDESNNSSNESGAAYVFRLNVSNIWSQISYLKSFNSETDDNFGRSVAISGDSIVVGATGEDGSGGQAGNNNVSDSGAVYVFNGIDEIWSQQRITKSFNIDAGDRFGHALAMSETTLVVGAFQEDSASAGVNGDESDNTLSNSGAVYIFTRNAQNRWIHQAYLKASNPDANDWFGYSVAISGDTIVVGARNERSNATGVDGDENNNSAFQAGAVYVFTRSNNTWSQQAYIKPSNTGAGDFFGFNVTVSGDTLVAGAVFEDSDATGVDGDDNNNLAEKSGATYVFVRDAQDNWSQESYLKASNTDASDEFGRAVSLAGDTLIVSANREDSDSSGVGAINNNNGDNTGAVYVFVRDNGVWQQEAYIKALNPGNGDEFGRSIALSPSGFTFVVGARNEDSNSPLSPDNNSAGNSGAVYGFRKALGTWIPFGYIKAPNLDAGDWFGDYVAISEDDRIVVGASREDSSSKNVNSGEGNNSLNSAGAAYVFTSDIVGNWSLQTYLKASNSGAGDIFGAAAIAKSSLVIGASLEDSSSMFNNDNAVDSGAVYSFDTSGSDIIFENGFE